MFKKIFNLEASIAGRRYNQEKREQILAEFKKIDLGRKMLHWAEENGVKIQFKKLSDKHGYYSPSAKKVVIDSDDSDDSAARSISTLAHELRHAWQWLENEHLTHPGIHRENPFANCILTRFREADAFSFEEFFMLKYLGSLNSSEKVNALLDSETRMLLDLVALKQQTEDNPTDMNVRRTAFEYFFYGPYKSGYDQNTTVEEPIIEGWLLTKLATCFTKAKQGSLAIKEEGITSIGKCAWGECAGQNFLEANRKPFDLTDDKYTGSFDGTVLKHLRKISALPYYQGMNVIQMKNGQQRPLIRLDK